MPEGEVFNRNRFDSNGFLTVKHYFGENLEKEGEEDRLISRLNNRLSEDNLQKKLSEETDVEIEDVKIEYSRKQNQMLPGVSGEIIVDTKESRMDTDIADSNSKYTQIVDVLCDRLSKFQELGPAYEEGIKRDCNITFPQFSTRARGIILKTEKPAVVSPIALRYPMNPSWSMDSEQFEDLEEDIIRLHNQMFGPRDTSNRGEFFDDSDVEVDIDENDLVIKLNYDGIGYRDMTALSKNLFDMTSTNDFQGLLSEFPVIEAL